MADVEMETPEVMMARFEELSALESEFDTVDLEIIRKAEALQAPLYKKRADFVAKIPHFWPLVFEQAPPEIDNFIQPSDSKLFADSLETFEVTRFELNNPKGSPRSFSLKFGFKENEYFEDKVIEKKFWFRSSKDWDGLVSEPVQINWKKGKDLTGGLTDAAFKLNEARKKLGLDTSDEESRKKEKDLPEYKALSDKLEQSLESSISFFGIFAFVSGYRWISAEESAKAIKEENERMEKIRRGETVDDDDEDEEEMQDFQDTEVFPGGDEVVTIIAEDMWPNAIKYYKATFDEEEDDEDLSELEISESEMMMDQDDSDEDAAVDIRALVGKGKGKKSEHEPPSKKQRKK